MDVSEQQPQPQTQDLNTVLRRLAGLRKESEKLNEGIERLAQSVEEAANTPTPAPLLTPVPDAPTRQPPAA
jgi:aspartate oxidase